MREGNWKLLCEYDWNDSELSADPSDTMNIANDHAAVVYRLTQDIFPWQKSMPQATE